ncbi:MAG: ABC transporter ATP-binding protein [Candidatus Saccharimonadales bacterium]
MNEEIAISVQHVNKTFRLPLDKNSSLKGAIINFASRKKGYELQKALKDINFEVKKGEFFGIVGRNGSGKSTLLKLLAGIYTPDSGNIQINGKLTPFIELGVGFSPELTGRENIFLNGALLGFNRKEMTAMYSEIVEFAELEKFMDQKLKNYSSGMQVRLAFSIAIRAQSPILLLDEVLAVGDSAFQSKCYEYFNELKKSKTTVVFVSHDRTSLERFCNKGILINNGKLVRSGSMKDVLDSYSDIVLEGLDNTTKTTKAAANQSLENKNKSKNAQIESVVTTDDSGHTSRRFKYGDSVFVEFSIRITAAVTNPIFGVTIWQNGVNKAVYATNSLMEEMTPLGVLKSGEAISCKVALPKGLNNGEYSVEPAIANEAGSIFYDRIQNATKFYISGSNNSISLIASRKALTIEKG